MLDQRIKPYNNDVSTDSGINSSFENVESKNEKPYDPYSQINDDRFMKM